MDELQSTTAAMYWCHLCNRRVEPVLELETIECPSCQSGFVEQMSHTVSTSRENRQIPDDYFFGGGGEFGPDSDRALSLLAPALLGMMSNPRRRRRFRRRLEFEYEDDDDILNSIDEGESHFDRELQSFIRSRRRNPAAIRQFLQGIRARTISESSNNTENENEGSERDTTEIRDRNRVILINPLNQTIILQGGNFRNRDHNLGGSVGDYFVGSGLDFLLQHLAENDPNRYGTPPAKKEDVEAMPMVKVRDNMQCSVCLDDLEMGTEAKEMPCKHKFHSGCILPWLELHSSCPVCRYQLPSDGHKIDSNQPTSNNSTNTNVNPNNMNSNYDDNNSTSSSSGQNSGGSSNDGGNVVEERNGRTENRRGFSVPFPWPFSNLFSSLGIRGSSSSTTNTTRNASSTDEN